MVRYRYFASALPFFFVTACADTASGPTRQAERAIPMSAASAQILAAVRGRRSRGVEDEILRLEAQIPGLGGLYFNGATGKATIYLIDLGTRASALATMHAAAPTLNLTRRMRSLLSTDSGTDVLQGQFAFSDLVAWQQAIVAHARATGLTTVDADEARNRVTVGVPNSDARDAVTNLLGTLGIPAAAVIFEDRPAGYFLADSVRNYVRPTAGGTQIANENSAICTLGANVDMQFYGEKGFLTASHCDADQLGAGGTGDTIYQDVKSSSDAIGVVELDPAWNVVDPLCGGYTTCTDGDVMFVRAADTSSTEWAKRLAETTMWGYNNTPGTLEIDDYYTGLSSIPFVASGDTLYKTGRTTGTTFGQVGATCTYYTDPVSSSAQTCVDRVDSASVGHGDSGAPVFYPPYGDDPAYFAGVLSAGYWQARWYHSDGADGWCTHTCQYYFTEWPEIETHLSRYFTP